jgi:hypothetical protein
MLSRIGQEKPDRNRTVFKILQSLGYSPIQIRKAMALLEGVDVAALAEGQGLSTSLIYSTIAGLKTGEKRRAPRVELAKMLFATRLGIDVDDVFPENGNGKDCDIHASVYFN